MAPRIKEQDERPVQRPDQRLENVDVAFSDKIAKRYIDAHEAVFDLRGPKEYANFAAGLLILLVAGPAVGVVLLGAMLWEWADRGFDGAFVNSGKELSGLLCKRVAPYFNAITQPINEKFVKKAEDAYMMNSIVAFGVGVPLMFAACAYNEVQRMQAGLGLSFSVWWLYHLIRIGPYFMNFAYVYTLCHKEGHARTGLFSKPYNNNSMLRSVFNWWIGLFYGVMPGTFKYGHSVNHHRYNNGYKDVHTTSDKPRDSFVNWIAYVPRWMLFATNVSTLYEFALDGEWELFKKITAGNIWVVFWLSTVSYVVSPSFAVAYVLFPVAEAGILLAAVNWSWHAFLEPSDPENEYVQSITILDGAINVLEEDFHVVHHQYPGAHWTGHVNFFAKHWGDYASQRASLFQNTHAFEIFGMVLARDYDMLAQKFVDVGGGEAVINGKDGRPMAVKPEGKSEFGRVAMTHEEKVQLIKGRLRATWWGPRADPEVVARLSGKEVGNLQYGKGITAAQNDVTHAKHE